MALMLIASAAMVFAGCSGEKTKTSSQGNSDENPQKIVQKSNATEEVSVESKTESNDKLLKQVKYYKTGKKKSVPKQGQQVITKVAVKAKVKLGKANLQDRRYREMVLGLATNLQGLSKAEAQAIVEYAKYVDAYENEIKNKRIAQLSAKIKSGKKITGIERAELKSLLPVDLGVKLSLSSKVGIKSTKIKANASDKKTSDKKDNRQSKGTVSKAQTPNTDQKGRTDLPQSQTEVNTSRENNTRQQTEMNRSGDGRTQPQIHEDQHDQQNGGANNGGQTNRDQNNDDSTNDDPTNRDQNNGNEQEGGVTSGGQQNGELTGNKKIPAPSYGYDAKKARDYAYKWWNKRNNQQYGYYSRAWGGCYDCWLDCTNFVSQALQAGGIKEQRTGGTYWYYSDKKPTYSWGIAYSLFKHLKTRAKQTRNYEDLEVGDIVNGDFDHDGDIEHSTIVTRVDDTGVYITQHTSDKKDAPLIDWFVSGFDVYGWKMGTANIGH